MLEFFIEARKSYEFSVIVVENSPQNSGEFMSKQLSKHGINTTLISDISAFAYMSKVSKIITSTRAIMANGGLITDSGVEMVILAADFHTVPVIVVSTLYKLTPLYPYDNTTYNTMISPELIFNSKNYEFAEKVDVTVSFLKLKLLTSRCQNMITLSQNTSHYTSQTLVATHQNISTENSQSITQKKS